MILKRSMRMLLVVCFFLGANWVLINLLPRSIIHPHTEPATYAVTAFAGDERNEKEIAVHHILPDYAQLLLAQHEVAEAHAQAAHDAIADEAKTKGANPSTRGALHVTVAGAAFAAVIALLAMVNGR